MEVRIFGKLNCARCETTKKKIAFFLDKWRLSDAVPVVFFDMDTMDGRAEGAFDDVVSVPTTILRRDETSLARWDGTVPDSKELMRHLEVSPVQ